MADEDSQGEQKKGSKVVSSKQVSFSKEKKKKEICLSSSRPASHVCHHIKLWIVAVKNA